MGKHRAPSFKKYRLRRGFLSGVFAAAATLGIGAQACAANDIIALATDQPIAIDAMGTTAARVPLALPNWLDMLKRQHRQMADSNNAGQFNFYMTKFNKYKGEPLDRMARDVNADVLNDIIYNDNYPNSAWHWQTPFETEVKGQGNCHDYAALQYFILRHLGVPADQLYFGLVNANGKKTQSDHIILLVNTAPDGQKNNWIVLNDGGPVTGANDYLRPDGANEDWPKPYVLYAVFNEKGTFMTGTTVAALGRFIPDEIAGAVSRAIDTAGKKISSLAQDVSAIGRKGLPGIAEIPKLG